MKRKYLIVLNYFFLAFIFVWQSLRMTIFEGIDGKGRLSIAFSLAIFLVNLLSSKKFIKSLYGRKSILKFWGFWLLYTTINILFPI